MNTITQFTLSSTERHSFRRLTFLGICLLLGSIANNAGAQLVPLGQDVARPIEGVGHDYIHGISETVNPATGNLSIKIELPTPKSRGVTLPFSLSYNSGAAHNLRSFITGYMTVDGTTLVNGYSIAAVPTEMGSGGWTDSFPYAALSTWIMPVAPPSSNITATCTYSSSYAFYDPAGASHILGLDAVSNPSSLDNVTEEACSEVNNYQYKGQSYGGDSQMAASSPSQCDGTPAHQVGSGCWNAAPPFTVADKFGTTYSFPGGNYSAMSGMAGTSYRAFVFPSSIEDRNGNTSVRLEVEQNQLVAGLRWIGIREALLKGA